MVDVVVIGYGPVGATAANFLGQAGLDVVCVERDLTPFARARAISTDEDVLRCWQHVGLAEELKADMLGGRPIDFVDSAGDSFMSWSPTPKGNGHPTQMFIYQPALEATIRKGTARFPNVTVLLEHEAGRVRQDSGGVEVDVTDLRDGSRRTLKARYLLACDGGSSPVRTQLRIGFEGKTYEDPWVVIDTKVLKEWPEVDRLRFHCDPVRPAVDCPTPLGHHRWEFPILPGEDRDEVSSEAAIWRMLSRYGITAEHVEILRRAVYVHHVRFAERWRERRIFLLGDAAHCMPPWIGQGMASGVRDAANLSWKLAAVLRGRAADSLLDSYEAERMPHVRRTTSAAVFFGRVITEKDPRITRVRDHLFRGIMRAPVAGRYLRDGDWMEMPDYRRGGFVDRSSGRALSGRRLTPQPVVVDHDGRRTLLDDVLAEEWSVLLLDSAAQRTTEARRAWERLGARTFLLGSGPAAAPGELQDTEGTLIARLQAAGVDALVLRPDAYVYTVAKAGEALAGPPLALARPAAAAGVSAAPAPSGGEKVLALAAGRLDDRGLELAFGHPVALAGIFGQMAAGFVPRVANGFEGRIVYDLQRQIGPGSRFTVTIAGGRAKARPGAAADAALTVHLSVADFLRMAAGQIDQVDLLKGRRIDMTGDGLLAARMGAMFGRPAVPDIYTAPTTVDPPALARDLQEA